MAKATVYGLFDGEWCIYVGCTGDPATRERQQAQRFTKILGRRPQFKILRTVSIKKAAEVEHSLIVEYRTLGQAQFNKATFRRHQLNNRRFQHGRTVSFKCNADVAKAASKSAYRRTIPFSMWLREAAEEKMMRDGARA